MTDNRQTDHAMEKCVGIGGIVCAARVIPSNNYTVGELNGPTGCILLIFEIFRSLKLMLVQSVSHAGDLVINQLVGCFS